MKKAKKYKLSLTFTKSQMEAVREEVAAKMESGRLKRKTSALDELCYTIAWTCHQALSGRKVKSGSCSPKKAKKPKKATKKNWCPYCGHSRDVHAQDKGCTEVVLCPQLGPAYTDQCPCTRFPDKAGRWRR